MNQIRTALTEVREAVDVPAADRVALGARVRAERRRRTTGRVLVGAAAAAVVGAVALTVPGFGGADRATPGPAAPGAADVPLSEPVWFVQDGRLTALDPAGELHRLDQDADTVVGWTTERVYALDGQGLVAVDTRWDAERQELRAGVVDPPTSAAVTSSVLSGDGRYLAWSESDRVTVLDEKSHQDATYLADAGTSVVAVGAAGVLIAQDGELVLRDGDRSIPVEGEGADGVTAQLTQEQVLVSDPDGDGSSLLNVGPEAAELRTAYPGTAVLGPYAERVAVLTGDPQELRVLEVGPGGTGVRVTGLDGVVPDEVRWADETRLLVRGHDAADVPGLWSCDIDMTCRQLPVEGEVGF